MDDIKITASSSAVARAGSPRYKRGFTLIEIMVVVVIIVLMIGMALPVFHGLTASRSEEGARNLIAATLGRARADAIGLNQPIGIAFIYNPTLQKTYMAEVSFPDCPEWSTAVPYSNGSCTKRTTASNLAYYFFSTYVPTPPGLPVTQPLTAQVDRSYWQWVGGPPIEIRPDTDLIPLPSGVGAQTICNCSFNNGARSSDGYLSVGAIFFDGKGRLASIPYGIPLGSRLIAASGVGLAFPDHSAAGQGIGIYNYGAGSPSQFGVLSQVGLVVYQKDAFVAQNFPTSDPMYNTSINYLSGSTPSQLTEETWLDTNAAPILINRYTGTVIKGE
jgi:prepilin-type N-terminal cleavage/methylation domain-containing protein